jgi:SAM-dependent methyltransferase
MSEVKTGLRGLLANPTLYELFRRMLDVGCGPGELLRCVPGVTYVGFDSNPSYIERAKRIIGDRGTFFAERYEESDIERHAPSTPRFCPVCCITFPTKKPAAANAPCGLIGTPPARRTNSRTTRALPAAAGGPTR